MKQLFVGMAIVVVLAGVGEAGEYSTDPMRNWPAWRGPLANGTAPHADPPLVWSRTKNLKWKLDLPGQSNATPIVWADKVFVVAAVETDRAVDRLAPPKMEPPGGYRTERPKNYYRFLVYCVDRETGRVRWKRVAAEQLPHEGHNSNHGYASGSPTTDGRRLYVTFGSRGIFCYDLDGNLLWKRDLGDTVTRFGWGEGASPTLYGNSLVVNWDHEGPSALFVLDATTGRTKWKVDRDEETTWSTPLVVEHRGVKQLIVNATRRVTSYDLDSGKILWECGGQTEVLVSSPVVLDDVVICMSGFLRSAIYAIPLDSTGDLTGTDRVAWHYDRGAPYVPSPLLYGELLHFTKGNQPVRLCLNARTGRPLSDAVRLPDLREIYASPLGAAGRVYIVGRDGNTLVVRNEAELDVLAVNRLDDPIDASPAAVGRDLFLRSKRRLYCISRTSEAAEVQRRNQAK